MRVLLISANREEINMRTWPLGPACVAAATERAGHAVKLLDLMAVESPERAVMEAIEGFLPEVIGISVRNVDDQNMTDPTFFLEDVKKIVSLCRSRSSAPIVLGGAGYSIYPIPLLDYLKADMGIQGEGEIGFPALLERLETGADLSGVPGLYLPGLGLQGARRFNRDLDRLPLPEPRLLIDSIPADSEFWFPVQTRRGCPMNCSYCSTASIEGRIFRERSPERIVQWLSELASRGFRRYYFVDNTFNIPPSYAKKLCAKLAAAGLDIIWRCIVYPVRIDQELARLMAAAGCKEVAVGFESGSELILHGLNKKFKPETVRHVCEVFAQYGIRRMGFLLLGGPGETKETALQSLAFADSLNLDAMKVTVGIRIYPGTALAKEAVAEGLVKPDDDLLTPRFFMTPGLEEWLVRTAEDWISQRPNWLT